MTPTESLVLNERRVETNPEGIGGETVRKLHVALNVRSWCVSAIEQGHLLIAQGNEPITPRFDSSRLSHGYYHEKRIAAEGLFIYSITQMIGWGLLLEPEGSIIGMIAAINEDDAFKDLRGISTHSAEYWEKEGRGHDCYLHRTQRGLQISNSSQSPGGAGSYAFGGLFNIQEMMLKCDDLLLPLDLHVRFLESTLPAAGALS